MKRALLFVLLFVALLQPNEAIAEPYPYELLETIKQLEVQLQELKAEQERQALVTALKTKLRTAQVPANTLCSCVQTAKFLGVKIPNGHDAWELQPNTTTPEIGQLVLMSYIKTGHVAVIADITEDGYLIVEGNYRTCQWTERLIPKDYYALSGFWSDGEDKLLAK